ncbi:MAG: septum site-determining protein MinC [Anaerolineales bacterium]|nr:septum site-determining protein MinC [Anaerolineales bacterium]
METKPVIKGLKDGLLIQLPQGEWEAVLSGLKEILDTQAAFFRGADVTLDLQSLELGVIALSELRDTFLEHDIMLHTVQTDHRPTSLAAADLGIQATHSDDSSHEPDFESELPGDPAVLLHRTVRSGQTIHHPGHVIVLGDINPGAEIIAGGNIVVWGRVRGTVHAGAMGDEDAVVCALDLSPTQLRIADQIAISPERKGKPRPEIARLRNHQLVAEIWNPDKKMI